MFAIAWYDDAKSANLFKKFGAKIDEEVGGNTPFLASFMWKRFTIAQWFLKNGAAINFADSLGNTALFYAVKRKYNIEYISLLVQFGADFDKKNNDGISPKRLAELNSQKKILGLFRRG
jgi:ankyrin repeat protein